MKDNFIKKHPDIALELLHLMKKIRMAEETIAKRYSEGKMRCPTHLCTGQEAIGAAVGLALRKNDFVVSTHRAHGHYLGKGGNLNKLIAEIYGKVTGCSKGKGGSMHLIDKDVGFMGSTAIVGGTIPVGVGLGLSIKLHETDQVSCIYLGDGATEEGVFYESLNFAALKKLPVLFICENNLYSVYSPLKVRQPKDRKIYQMVDAIGVPGDSGNGNSAIEVYDKATVAIDSIRQGHGPRFLEFDTFRWREHCGPNFDNDLGYRTVEEYLLWKEKDPISLIVSQISDQNVSVNLQTIELNIQKEIDAAFDYAEASSFPMGKEAFTDLYKS